MCVVITGLASYVSSLMLAWGAVQASTVLHNDILRNCMRSPSSFYDTTPLGRILNRFSKDTDTIDTVIPQCVRAWLMCTFHVLSVFLDICSATPLILLIIAPLGILYFFVQVASYMCM